MNELHVKYRLQLEEIVDVCKRASELGYGAGSGGNVSYRVEEDLVLITPSGIVKRKIAVEDICFVTLAGEPVYIPEGRKPTGEIFMHLHIMRLRPDVKGIMHAHPPIIVGMSLTDAGAVAMKLPILPEAATALGPVITIPYVKPNCDELGYSFDPYIMKSNAFIMGNHGCLVCCASGVKSTVEFVQIMESSAKTVLSNRLMGDAPRLLNDKDMEGLDMLLKHRGEVMPCPPNQYTSMKEMFEKC